MALRTPRSSRSAASPNHGALLALSIAFAALAACASDSTSEGPADSAPPDDEEQQADEVAFVPATAIQLAPKERRSVDVQVSPPGSYSVEFALLGDALDASLDRSEARTDAAGRARVSLTAPASALAAAFRLRAAVGGVASELRVTMSARGFATLEVTPDYAGERTIESWVASVHVGTSCSELAGRPIADGELAETAAYGKRPRLTGVPAGRELAVTVRSQRNVTGCTRLAELVPNQLNAVSVPMADVPLRLDSSELRARFSWDPSKPALSALLAPEIANTEAALRGDAPDDLAALFDAMQEELPETDEREAFSAARVERAWAARVVEDPELAQRWISAGSEVPDGLRRVAGAWLRDAAKRLDASALTAELASDTGGGLELLPRTFGGLPADAAALTLMEDTAPSWWTEAGDWVVLGASFSWTPRRYLAKSVEDTLAEVSSGPDTPALALSAELDCDGLGVRLVGANDPPDGYAFASCDLECVETLCEAGLARVWGRAPGPAEANAELTVSATARAEVDADARARSFSGSWVGTLHVGQDAETSLTGDASAVLPANEP
jgi:hypothetical protein